MKQLLDDVAWTVIRWKILCFLFISGRTSYVYKHSARKYFDSVIKKVITNDRDPTVFDRYSEIMHAIGCEDDLLNEKKNFLLGFSSSAVRDYLEYLGEQLKEFLQALADNATLSDPELFPMWLIELNKLLTEIPNDISQLVDFEIKLTYYKVVSFENDNTDLYSLKMHYQEAMIDALLSDFPLNSDTLDKIYQAADTKASLLNYLFSVLGCSDDVPVKYKISILKLLRMVPKTPDHADWLVNQLWPVKSIFPGHYDTGDIL